MLSEPEKRELIQHAAEGDRFALERLLLHYSPSLRHHLAGKMPESLQRTISVDDILQQAYIQAFRTIGTLKYRTPQSFYVWLRTVAENHLRDVFRLQNRMKRRGDKHKPDARWNGLESSIIQLVEILSDRGDTPGNLAVRREAIEAVRVGLAGLPGDQRQAICLHCLEGKTLPETAAEMQRTTGAIRGLVQRAKKELREALRRSSLWMD